MSWYAPRRSAARTGGSSPSTRRAASASTARSSGRTRWTVPYASCIANARSRSSSGAAAERNARSAYASCSKTRRTTSYATPLDLAARAYVRRERADPVVKLFGRPGPVELAVGGGDLLGPRDAVRRLGHECGLGECLLE